MFILYCDINVYIALFNRNWQRRATCALQSCPRSFGGQANFPERFMFGSYPALQKTIHAGKILCSDGPGDHIKTSKPRVSFHEQTVQHHKTVLPRR